MRPERTKVQSQRAASCGFVFPVFAGVASWQSAMRLVLATLARRPELLVFEVRVRRNGDAVLGGYILAEDDGAAHETLGARLDDLTGHVAPPPVSVQLGLSPDIDIDPETVRIH